MAEHDIQPVGPQAMELRVTAETNHVDSRLGHALSGAFAPVADLAHNCELVAQAGERQSPTAPRRDHWGTIRFCRIKESDAVVECCGLWRMPLPRQSRPTGCRYSMFPSPITETAIPSCQTYDRAWFVSFLPIVSPRMPTASEFFSQMARTQMTGFNSLATGVPPVSTLLGIVTARMELAT